jgi:hypothetical protein
MMMLYSSDIANGQWLGSNSEVTLFKGPMFPHRFNLIGCGSQSDYSGPASSTPATYSEPA